MVSRNILLTVFDSVFAGVIIAPFTTAYWRGTWGLMNIHLLPNNPEHSVWTSVVIGGLPLLLLGYYHYRLTEVFKKDNWVVWLFVFHAYTYATAFCCVNLWRGVWVAWNHYTGTGVLSSSISMVTGWLVLVLLRASKSVVAPPAKVSVDTDPEFFTCTSRFKTKPTDRENYLLDHLLTDGLIASLVVFFWRGLWVLADNVLFPSDPERSAWASLAIGYGLYSLCVILQFPLQRVSVCLEKHPMINLITEDVFHLFVNCSAVMIWRGVWKCCDIYIWPDEPSRSCLLTHGLGLGVLMLLLNGNSVLVRGCIDGDLKEGRGMLIPNEYLRYYFPHPPTTEVNSRWSTEGDMEEEEHMRNNTNTFTTEPGKDTVNLQVIKLELIKETVLS